ncbi:MAG: hypothetical protein LC803_03665 [Acidobacteria bacterium]|nr:hypothetical protein [Acidobacteriota bacterium]
MSKVRILHRLPNFFGACLNPPERDRAGVWRIEARLASRPGQIFDAEFSTPSFRREFSTPHLPTAT